MTILQVVCAVLTIYGMVGTFEYVFGETVGEPAVRLGRFSLVVLLLGLIGLCLLALRSINGL